MEQEGAEALENLDVAAVARRFGRTGLTFVGGFENAVFDLGAGHILRLTHVSHRSVDAVRGELEWLRHLAARGAGVCAPASGLHPLGDFCACVFVRAPGRTIIERDWTPSLFDAWGRLIGSLHAGQLDVAPRYARWHWRDDQNFAFERRIPRDQERVLDAGRGALAVMADIPEDPQAFGLVHGDAHPGNFHLGPGGRLALFDFDDCHYNHLAFDLASVLLAVAQQPWTGATQNQREGAVAEFLPPFLAGYAQYAAPLPLLPALTACLKLRELSQYAIIVNQVSATEQQSDPFVSRFMAGRRARIEAGAPFLEIDFAALF